MSEAIEKLANQLEEIVLQRIATDRLNLPSLSSVVEASNKLLRGGDIQFKMIAQILHGDPVMAARIMRAAGAAAFGQNTPRTIESALVRLGTQRIRKVLIEAAARAVFTSRNARIEKTMRELWEHSIAVAHVARDAAALAGDDGAGDYVYLAGLLHDVGKPVVASLLLELERSQTGRDASLDPESWVGVVNCVHRKVGVALAEKWDLPAEVVEGIKNADDYNSVERTCISNYVRFANAVVKQCSMAVGPVNTDDVAALVMIGRSMLGIEEAIVTNLTAGIRERVRVYVSTKAA